jgi:hypothetical protein
MGGTGEGMAIEEFLKNRKFFYIFTLCQLK